MSISASEEQRLNTLKDNFRVIANRRWGLSLDKRVELVERATYDLQLFAQALSRRHGLEALPTLHAINDFLTNSEAGAPKFIEITMRPRPLEQRLPFTPSEKLKRQCLEVAQGSVREVIRGYDCDY